MTPQEAGDCTDIHIRAGSRPGLEHLCLGPLAWQVDSSLSAVLVGLWLVFVLNSCLQGFPAGPEAAEASLTLEDRVWEGSHPLPLRVFVVHHSHCKNPPSSSPSSTSLEANLEVGKKKNALFLVFLGINYFYGILDRQQTIKKKTVDFLLSRKQAVSTISGSVGKPGENLSIHHHDLSQNSPEVVSRASAKRGPGQ